MLIYTDLILVTPCMGVWIETFSESLSELSLESSHPVWVCGLKHSRLWVSLGDNLVTPCMGVWIETVLSAAKLARNAGHTLYGCVD